MFNLKKRERVWDNLSISEKLKSITDSPNEVVVDVKGFSYVAFKDGSYYKKTMRGAIWDRIAPHRLPKNKESRLGSGKFDFITAIKKLKDIKPLNGYFSCYWKTYYPVRILVSEDNNFQMYCGGSVINLGNLENIDAKKIEHRLHLIHKCLETALYELSFCWREHKENTTNNSYLQKLLANNEKDLRVEKPKYIGDEDEL